jgi:hypothetical protein
MMRDGKKIDMSPSRQQDDIVPESPASWAAIERESREVRAVNLILAQRVVESEDLVAELRQTIKEGSRGSRVSPDLLEERESTDQDRQDLIFNVVEDVINVSARKPSEGSRQDTSRVSHT